MTSPQKAGSSTDRYSGHAPRMRGTLTNDWSMSPRLALRKRRTLSFTRARQLVVNIELVLNDVTSLYGVWILMSFQTNYFTS